MSLKDCLYVVEDSVPNRKILSHYLRMYGFEVIEFEDGQEALDALNKNSESENVLAIFSDLMMPNLDGLGLLKEVRALESSAQSVPFVFISAVLDGDQVMEAMQLGIKDYLLKPITKEKVEEKLNEIFPDQELSSKK